MGNPITWRTVNGPSLGDPGRSMELASRSFNSMFGGLQEELKQREALEAKNFLVQQENQKNTFLDAVAGYETPEALASNRAALEAQRAALNPLARAATRGATEQRITALRDQTIKAGQYADTTLEREQRPLVQSIMTDAYSRDPVRMAKAQDTILANPALMKSAEMQKVVSDSMRQNVIEGREDTRFKWDGDKQQWAVAEEAQKAILRPIAVKQANLQLDATQAGINASNESVLTNRTQREKVEADRLDALNTAKLGVALQDNIYKEGVYTDASAADIMKMMIDNGVGGPKEASDSPAKRQKIIERLSKIREIPITVDGPDGQKIIQKVPLPLGAVKAAILGAGDNTLSWNEGRADNVETVLKAQLQAIYQSKDASGKPIVASRAVDDYQNFLAIQSAAAASAAGGTKPKKPKSQ